MRTFAKQSLLMYWTRCIGFNRLAWSLRRLHCPVSKDSLVLDVGSGGNPYPRANVLLDGYEDTIERYHSALVKDRPIVLGKIEKLPFKDKTFDFVIASHVLEHSTDPEAFLRELMRVGKAGYIETPDAFFERINPFRFHRLEVFEDQNTIQLFRKASWKCDPELVELYEKKLKQDKHFSRFLSVFPEPFYMRFYWEGDIKYRILNPEVDINWPLPTEKYAKSNDRSGEVNSMRRQFVKLIRFLFSQNVRNKKIDLISLLICTECGSEALSFSENKIMCDECNAIYRVKNGIPMMFK
nr:class I SAM-dependent methyltransferase [uncultured Desulfobacter sp.]